MEGGPGDCTHGIPVNPVDTVPGHVRAVSMPDQRNGQVQAPGGPFYIGKAVLIPVSTA